MIELDEIVLFDYEWFDKICDRIIYLISEKGGVADTINHNFARIRIGSHDSLPIEYIDFSKYDDTH